MFKDISCMLTQIGNSKYRKASEKIANMLMQAGNFTFHAVFYLVLLSFLQD